MPAFSAPLEGGNQMLSRKLHLATVALAVLAMGTLALSGCRDEDSVSAVGTSDSPLVATTTPTLAEVQGAVTLTGEQAETVEAALRQWRASVIAKEQARRVADGDTEPRRFRGSRPGAHIHDFVAAVAPSLDTEQLEKLVVFLADHRDRQMAQRRELMKERKGKRGRGFDGGEALGLDEEQKAALAAAREETRAAMRELHEEFRNGEISEEEMFEQASALHDAMREKLADILTEEQLAKWTERREARMTRMLERRLEHLGDNVDRRVEFLTAVLGLSGEVSAQLRAALEAAIPQERAILESLREGTITRTEAREKTRALRAATHEAMEALFIGEQLDRLAALEPIMRRGRRG
jgi:hypothetical protein